MSTIDPRDYRGHGRAIDAVVDFELLYRRRDSRLSAAITVWAGATLPFCLASISDAICRLAGHRLSADMLICVLGAVAALLAVRMMVEVNRPGDGRMSAVRAMASNDDPAIVWLLLPQLGMFDSQTRRAVGLALQRLLPRLTMDHVSAAEPTQRAILRKALITAAIDSYEPGAVCALLETIARFGDRSDIKVVRHVIRLMNRRTGEGVVRSAAARCLATLRTDENTARGDSK